MRTQPTTINWPGEKLLAALKLVIAEQDFTPLRKRIMFNKLAKQHRKGQLVLEELDTEWLYRLCCASLMLHEYHWFGWEFRSGWAAQVCTKKWVYPQWDGKKCRLLVLGEQGVGDEILFASCYNDLAQDVEQAWIETDPRLIPTFARSFPSNLHFVSRFLNDERRVVPRMDDYPKCHADKPIDAFIPAANVPKLYRHAQKDFPVNRRYLYADEEKLMHWADWRHYDNTGISCFGGHEFVGASWMGRQGSIPELSGRGDWFSLQYGDYGHGALRVPPIDLKWDLDTVFAFVAALDRVVTVPNAVAHIAGALGVPTDVIKPPPIYATKESGFNNRVTPFWPEDRTDWYPSVRMHRNYAAWRALQ